MERMAVSMVFISATYSAKSFAVISKTPAYVLRITRAIAVHPVITPELLYGFGRTRYRRYEKNS
jgi:hypothetical protein